MDPQLKAQCQQTIYVAQFSARDSFGDQTFGAPVAMLARVEAETQESDSPDGESRQSRFRVVTELEVRASDRVWLPGDDPTDGTLGREPMEIQGVPDERGNTDHYELLV